MSPDLTRALHDAVDAGPDDAPFDVLSLTGRIRRRRTVRAGVRSGVAVGAVGAVAFGAVYVGGRDPLSVLPAARADAGPGTCGSDIGLLPTAEPSRVGLLPSSTEGDWYMADPSTVPQPGTDLGALLGRTMGPMLVRELSPAARDAAVADLVRGGQKSLADAEERRASTLADPPGGVPLTEGQVAALDRGVEAARQQLASAEASAPLSGVGDELASRILITHDGTVVASDDDPSGARYSWMSTLDRSLVMSMTSTELSTCATDRDPGGEPLPAGQYAVYVSYAEAGGRSVAGPWSLTLLDLPPAPVGLPEGFPVDDVPLIGGRLVSVTSAGGSSGEGWDVQIAVDGDDAPMEAVRLLGKGVTTSSALAPPPGVSFPVAGWDVTVARSTSDDGEPTVFYTIRRD